MNRNPTFHERLNAGERLEVGGAKMYYSGHWVPHPISERLQEILRTWNWNEDVCEECGVKLYGNTERAKLGHLVTIHGYNMNGYVRKNASS